MATNPTAAALVNAKKALASADKFTSSVTGGKPNAFAPKAQSPNSDYSHAREARKSPEFLGINADAAPELKSAIDQREATKKAL